MGQMKTFNELGSELLEFKVVSKAARKKMAIRMRRQAQSSAFKTKVARAKLKVAPPEKLKLKAHKMAKQKIISKFFPKYNQLDLPARLRVDQIIATKYGASIAKIAQKIMPKMKALELEKVKAAKEAKANA
jgi:asparagine synthetase B (glutamine-hydrolysing)